MSVPFHLWCQHDTPLLEWAAGSNCFSCTSVLQRCFWDHLTSVCRCQHKETVPNLKCFLVYQREMGQVIKKALESFSRDLGMTYISLISALCHYGWWLSVSCPGSSTGQEHPPASAWPQSCWGGGTLLLKANALQKEEQQFQPVTTKSRKTHWINISMHCSKPGGVCGNHHNPTGSL